MLSTVLVLLTMFLTAKHISHAEQYSSSPKCIIILAFKMPWWRIIILAFKMPWWRIIIILFSLDEVCFPWILTQHISKGCRAEVRLLFIFNWSENLIQKQFKNSYKNSDKRDPIFFIHSQDILLHYMWLPKISPAQRKSIELALGYLVINGFFSFWHSYINKSSFHCVHRARHQCCVDLWLLCNSLFYVNELAV